MEAHGSVRVRVGGGGGARAGGSQRKEVAGGWLEKEEERARPIGVVGGARADRSRRRRGLALRGGRVGIALRGHGRAQAQAAYARTTKNIVHEAFLRRGSL